LLADGVASVLTLWSSHPVAPRVIRAMIIAEDPIFLFIYVPFVYLRWGSLILTNTLILIMFIIMKYALRIFRVE
ncbi:hypothetical protein RCJ20_15180, partial [Salmonella enterica subsp. enterica serovar Agona]|uniref:hypothetical protein n=1 Tax=Salmonella enterica TaxID=28901 RepID=UPI0027E54E66